MCISDNWCADINPFEARCMGVQLGCLGRMMALLGRCSALWENMRHVMRFQSIQDALPNRSSTKPRRLGTVQDGRYGAFLQHARWSVSGDSSNPACGGSAINRLYTPCTRKGCGIFYRYAQSAEPRKLACRSSLVCCVESDYDI
jgi:hypothetical protein